MATPPSKNASSSTSASCPCLNSGAVTTASTCRKSSLPNHTLKNLGKRTVPLGAGENPKLAPLTESGGGSVQEKEKALLAEIISRVNDLFDGDVTDNDQLVYVNNVIKGKLLENQTLVEQAVNNTKEQFASSPDLSNGLLDAIIDTLSAHTIMSKQALESERVRSGLRDILLGPAQLYESLRSQRDVGALAR
ncbi:MAG: type restriction endonuclease subunit [Bryobacterales bacterium]|jgi:type I restriction enzyme R subunit|nr:type restriction endonuclease subunit [Bryobacterales bacterium]